MAGREDQDTPRGDFGFFLRRENGMSGLQELSGGSNAMRGGHGARVRGLALAGVVMAFAAPAQAADLE
jgi:hypothetical protein